MTYRQSERNYGKIKDESATAYIKALSRDDNDTMDQVWKRFSRTDPGWGVYGNSPIKEYDLLDFWFSKDTTLREYIETKYGKDAHIIELMGPGTVIRQLGFRGTAVTLGDGRSRFEKYYDSLNEIETIEAVLSTENGWNSLPRDADFVILRPLAGWLDLPDTKDFYTEFIKHGLGLLNSKGEMLVKIMIRMIPQFQEVLEELENKLGVNVQYDPYQTSYLISMT